MPQGFSLLEVLISLCIISVGLFGFADAQLKAFKSIREIHHAISTSNLNFKQQSS